MQGKEFSEDGFEGGVGFHKFLPQISRIIADSLEKICKSA